MRMGEHMLAIDAVLIPQDVPKKECGLQRLVSSTAVLEDGLGAQAVCGPVSTDVSGVPCAWGLGCPNAVPPTPTGSGMCVLVCAAAVYAYMHVGPAPAPS